MIDRDLIYQTLFERLREELAGDILYFTRRLYHWENVSSQPALLLIGDSQRAEHQFNMPPVWTLGAEVYLYLQSFRSDQTPETAVNALVDKVERALQARVEAPATEWGIKLSGLVDTIRLLGVEVAQGQEVGQAVAIIRLEMVAAST